jgi:hypothetical protein
MENGIKPANLDYLFQELLTNYSHLIESKPMTKSEFLEVLKSSYSIANVKNKLFYQSCERSEFDTIRRDYNNIVYFNH